MKGDKVLLGALGVGLLSALVIVVVRYLTTRSFLMPVGFAEWSEIVGFITGVVGVYLVVKEHLLNYPVGIINVLTYAWFFFAVARHFANAWLQIVFCFFLIHGWWQWKFGGEDRKELSIGRASRGELGVSLGLAVVVTAVFYPILLTYEGNFIFLDALTTGISLGGQFLVNRKRVENWWMWIIADLIYVPLYIYRQYYLTAVLYAIFLVLAVLGLKEWLGKTKAPAQLSSFSP
jgi:nicotinamide mononucleotide transporter